MSNLHELTSFFGWMAILNIGILLFATLVITVGRDFVLSVHSRILAMPRDELNRLYVDFLSYHKLGTVMLSVVPYLALKIMGG